LLKLKDLQIVKLNNEIKILAEGLKKMQDEEKQLQNIKILFEDLTAKKLAFNTLKLKETGIDDLDKQVKAFEKCEQVFKLPLAGRNKLRQDLIKYEGEEKELQKDKTTLNNEINAETKKANNLRQGYANKDLLLQKAAELEKIIIMKSTEEAINNFSERIQKGETLVNVEITKLEAGKLQLEGIKAGISKAEQALPDTAALVAISNWFSKKSQFKKNYEKGNHELTDLTGKVLNEKNKIDETLQPLKAELKITSFPGNLLIVKERVDHLNKEYDDQIQILQEEQNHLKLFQKLDEFAKALTDDSECPLCGSLNHPKVFSAESISADAKQKEITIKDFEQKKKALNDTLISLSGLYSNYKTHLTQKDLKTKEFSFFLADMEKHTGLFLFAGYTDKDEDIVKMQLAAIEEQNKEIVKLRRERDDQEKLTEEANKNVLKYKEACEKLNTQKAQSEGQLNVLKTQIELHDLSIEIIKEVAALQIAAATLRSEYNSVTKEFEHAEKAIQQNTQKLAALTGKLEQLLKIINTCNNQKIVLDNQIVGLLSAEVFQTAEQVEVVLATKLDIKKEKDRIEGYKRELHSLDASLKDTIAKVEGKEYSEQLHAALSETIETAIEEQAEKTNQLVKERYELHELTTQMKARVELQKELDKLDLRGENLKILSNLFRSSGFVNYVSSVYLQNLVNAANERFYKMTQQKLRLELSADNSFTVRDFMNNGAVRSVKTLSGGQTFQAALSLALALADNIQYLTRSKQNFFFLDEGFGSLDKEALAIVFGTLKNLRMENRIVGVISHVEEMQQEIPVNLQIRNDADTGSYIKTSWN
jgi:exonuclease SbcC